VTRVDGSWLTGQGLIPAVWLGGPWTSCDLVLKLCDTGIWLLAMIHPDPLEVTPALNDHPVQALA